MCSVDILCLCTDFASGHAHTAWCLCPGCLLRDQIHSWGKSFIISHQRCWLLADSCLVQPHLSLCGISCCRHLSLASCTVMQNESCPSFYASVRWNPVFLQRFAHVSLSPDRSTFTKLCFNINSYPLQFVWKLSWKSCASFPYLKPCLWIREYSNSF